MTLLKWTRLCRSLVSRKATRRSTQPAIRHDHVEDLISTFSIGKVVESL